MARPSKFTEDMIERAEFFARKGFTDKEIAKGLGVAEDTVKEWRKSKPEFSATVKEGKAEADDLVERSLFERATGYSHPEDKIFMHEGCPVVVPTTKHYPPDTAAMCFWLKNRRPKEWREKTETDVNIPGLTEFFSSLPQNYGLPKE